MASWLLGVRDSPIISRNAVSPVEGLSERIEAEHVTPDEFRWAITEGVFPFGTKLTPDVREVARRVEESDFKQLRAMVPETYINDEELREIIKDVLDSYVISAYKPEPTTRRAKKP